MGTIDGERLLAVDLGLRTGFAVFDRDGRLHQVGSRRFGSRTQLRAGAQALLRGTGPIGILVVEGDRDLALLWSRAAQHLGARSLTVTPETWRASLLHPRERRTGTQAKEAASKLASEVVRELGAAPRTGLRHDAAEAVLIGLWGLLEVGWLTEPPRVADLRRR